MFTLSLLNINWPIHFMGETNQGTTIPDANLTIVPVPTYRGQRVVAGMPRWSQKLPGAQQVAPKGGWVWLLSLGTSPGGVAEVGTREHVWGPHLVPPRPERFCNSWFPPPPPSHPLHSRLRCGDGTGASAPKRPGGGGGLRQQRWGKGWRASSTV